jgi:hypothetical protein
LRGRACGWPNCCCRIRTRSSGRRRWVI